MANPKKGIFTSSALAVTIKPLAGKGGGQLALIGFALLYMAIVGIAVAYLDPTVTGSVFVIAAAVIGAYMAMNIGANDVANTMGPAVGSGALTLFGALAIAAIANAAGALLAGGDVVSTISK